MNGICNDVACMQVRKHWRENSKFLTYNSWLEIDKDSTGYVLACTCLAKESVERVVAPSNSFVRWHLSVWLDPVLKTVKFPTGIADLHTSLSNMN